MHNCQSTYKGWHGTEENLPLGLEEDALLGLEENVLLGLEKDVPMLEENVPLKLEEDVPLLEENVSPGRNETDMTHLSRAHLRCRNVS